MKDFAANPAPVIDLMGAQGASPFRILLATILSARTKDACTAKVIREQLFPVVSSWDDIRRLSVDELARLIYPVGFYRQKAAAIKQIIYSLIVAVLTYFVINNESIRHILYAFNEINLVILLLVMLLGTYTGYRLTELRRFAPLVKEKK